MAEIAVKANYFDKSEGNKPSPKDTQERKTVEALEQFPALANIPPATFTQFTNRYGQRVPMDLSDPMRPADTLRGEEAQKLVDKLGLPFKDAALTVRRHKWNFSAADTKGPYRIEAQRLQVFLPNMVEPVAQGHLSVLTYGRLDNNKFMETEILARTTASYKPQGKADYITVVADEVTNNAMGIAGKRTVTVERGGLSGKIIHEGSFQRDNSDKEFKINPKTGKPILSDLKTSMAEPQGKENPARAAAEHPFAELARQAKNLERAPTVKPGGLPEDLTAPLAKAAGSLKI